MSKRAVLAAALMAFAALTALPVLRAQDAGRRAAGGPALTPQDYLDLQQLVARYAYALDSGADNGNAYADLFTADGEFVLPDRTVKGRTALAAFGRAGFVDGKKPANGVSHFIMNHVIEPSSAGATGKEYVVLVNIGQDGKPGGEFSNVGGHYEDVYVRTSQGWRFQRREFIAMKPAPRRPGGAAPGR